ncbi:MAG TPA: carbohydrate ABC transporter permease [Casimicrobiaceae bacterium]|jgi:multiple sugar transport system permease protein|nr:carbohydrate ABC transporter permease [Casimicrobiaceae bacterium]
MSRRSLRVPATHGALLVAAIIVLFPFVWIALAAFKTQISLMIGEVLFTPTLAHFDEVLFSGASDYLANYRNSLVIATASTLLVLVVATLAAYSIERLGWPRWLVHGFLLGAAVFNAIPPITLVGAWYVGFRALGLYDTYLAVILAHATLNLPLGIWLMATFVREVPRELEEAARIDGCGTLQMLWRVIVPVVMPGIAATAVLVFIHSWNEFVVALNLTARETATVPVAISKYAQENETKYGAMAAGAVLSVLPSLVLLFFAQRAIVRGLTAGAVK